MRGCKDVARKVRRNLPGVSGCKGVGRDDTFPLCHCEERSDGTIRISLRWSMTESSTSGEYGKAANLPGRCPIPVP